MSHTPLTDELPTDDAGAASDGPRAEESAYDAYTRGWRAINRLMRSGHSWSGHEKNCAFLNLGDGTFANVSSATGFDFDDDARAIALLDVDGDGDQDLVATARTTPRVRMLENVGAPAGGAVSLLLEGAAANPRAIGARVELWREGEEAPLVRAVRAGEGYLAQSSAWLVFGLAGRGVERVVVHWPSGEVEEITGVVPGGRFVVARGSGDARPFAATLAARAERRGASAVPEAESARADAAATQYGRRIVLAAPLPLPALTIRGTDRREIGLFGIQPGGGGMGTGRTVLLNLWSSTCAPCVAELREYAPRRAELAEAGIAFLALSVDAEREGGTEEATATMERVEWPFAWGFATRRTLELLDTLHRELLDTELRMAVPTSFLIDPSGSLRAVYVGRVAPERLLDDLVLMTLTPDELVEHATPFRGTWLTRPSTSPAFVIGPLRAAGLDDAANEYERADLQVKTISRASMLHEFAREHAGRGEFELAIRTLRQAIEADPDFFPARFDLGTLLHQSGDTFGAIASYLEAKRLDPDHEDTRFNLALAYIATEQFPSARRELEVLRAKASPLVESLERVLEEYEKKDDR